MKEQDIGNFGHPLNMDNMDNIGHHLMGNMDNLGHPFMDNIGH